MRAARAALSTLILTLAVLGLTTSIAWADPYDADSVANLKAAEWSPYEADLVRLGVSTGKFTTYCKPVNDVTEDDKASLRFNDAAAQQAVKKISGHYAEVFKGTEHEQSSASDYAMYCVSPEGPPGQFFCVSRNRDLPEQRGPLGGRDDLPMECWDRDNNRAEKLGDEIRDLVANPVGTMVGSGIGEFATSLSQGFRQFIAGIMYWWIMVPHSDPNRWGSGFLWPTMTALSMLLGCLFLIGRGVKLMITGKPEIVLTTIKGLAKYVLVCAIGITVLTSVLHFSEWLTGYFLSIGSEAPSCAAYQSGQPDGLRITYDELEAEDARSQARSELAKSFGNCIAGQFAAGALSAGLVIVLFVVALIIGLVQALLMFVRESALPIMALLLPIAASGQIGGASYRKWLPGLAALIATLVLYKPMLAFVYAVGFTQVILGDEVISIIMGFLTLSIGVIAPGVMLKAFKPLMTMGVEEGASPGSVVNNFLQASQLSGSASRWAEKRAGEQAAQVARTHAAQQAAHAGGQVALTATKGTAQAASTGAAAAAGPVGWVAKAGQAAKSSVAWLGKKGKGPEGRLAAPHRPRPTDPHTSGPRGGLHLRQPGQHQSAPPPPEHPSGQNGPGAQPASPEAYPGRGYDAAMTPSLREPHHPEPENPKPRLSDFGPGIPDHGQEER